MSGRLVCISLATMAWRILPIAIFTLGVAHRAIAAALDFTAADFVILSADNGRPIGSVHYAVGIAHDGHQIVTSRARYNDGQSDVERDELDADNADLPVMSAYEHDFYRADGTIFLISKANFVSGDAACTSYADGRAQILRRTLAFPPDSYAGAALTLPLRKSLRTHSSGPILMHYFVCIPGPRVLKVAAYPQTSVTWDHFPGNLVRTAIKPDFGWVDYLIAPFIPKMNAWFSPSSDFLFVGGEFSRFYKGPAIILARQPSTPPDATVARGTPGSAATPGDLGTTPHPGLAERR